MISVQNHRRLSSGNKLVIFGLLVATLFVISCRPKKVVLAPAPQIPVEIEVEKDRSEEPKEEMAEFKSIALILPFQLDKINPKQPTAGDMKRVELALDFYQGFELGLREWASRGQYFTLEVLDSEDNKAASVSLGTDGNVRESSIVVGPVFPQEIKSFGDAFAKHAADKNVLQISPLAATMPSEFGLSNLVSLTPPISVHAAALAGRIMSAVQAGEAIIFYNTSDASSTQFLPLVRAEITKIKRNQVVYEVSNEEELRAHMRPEQTNLLVLGTDNHFKLIPILEEISNTSVDLNSKVKMYGHPNWAKLELGNQPLLSVWQAEITTSNYIDTQDSKTRAFDKLYRESFKIPPSDYAYKGYDAGSFVGELLSKYGDDYSKKIASSVYVGLHNHFEFVYEPNSGFVNRGVQFLEYRSSGFVKIK